MRANNQMKILTGELDQAKTERDILLGPAPFIRAQTLNTRHTA